MRYSESVETWVLDWIKTLFHILQLFYYKIRENNIKFKIKEKNLIYTTQMLQDSFISKSLISYKYVWYFH